ncbi:hypothetical protein ACH4JS_23370 [Streptomyces sp. NPDC017638]|uniref:hypothetical protein n=1 Tax=Streptomyces sp. NPDC017638 TaxID=3365004 RepID=UPI00378F472A
MIMTFVRGVSRPVRLGTWPTPLEPMRLAASLGLGAEDLWIKRDLSGCAVRLSPRGPLICS